MGKRKLAVSLLISILATDGSGEPVQSKMKPEVGTLIGKLNSEVVALTGQQRPEVSNQTETGRGSGATCWQS